MAPEAVTAGRAYRLLKVDLAAGRFKPGEIIIERVIAVEHNMSIAPLRDGAQRLVGEGLLEPGSRGGYRLPQLSEDHLRDLYQWHDHLVRLVLKSSDHTISEELAIPDHSGLSRAQAAHAATELFRLFANVSVNREHARALLAANDRLEPVRRREAVVLPNVVEELDLLRQVLLRGSGHDRFDQIRAYHRRRIRRANKIIAALVE